ncbi:MAG: NRDE family protein [Pseudohongiellaceae bacterium]
MCLVVFAFHQDIRYPLVLAANRDEFFARPTRDAQFWQEDPETAQILAGRDLSQGGTWLGINRIGRIAIITNIRDPSISTKHKLSRGRLVLDFLTGALTAVDYLNNVRANLDAYAGFNLLIGDWDSLYFLNSDNGEPLQLAPGIYGISNGSLDDPWPKVTNGKLRLQQLMLTQHPPKIEQLMQLLQNRDIAADSELPATGVPLELERRLSASFIVNPQRDYGTRCSTALVIDQRGMVQFCEQNYRNDGETSTRHYYEFEML